VYDICILEPFVSKYGLLVTPVVAFLSNLAILDDLKPGEGEVAEIFDHPLQAVLDPSLAKDEPLVLPGSEHWPYDAEYQVRWSIIMRNSPSLQPHSLQATWCLPHWAISYTECTGSVAQRRL
jgi:hypothetical protein